MSESDIIIKNINILDDDIDKLLLKDRYTAYKYDDEYTVIDMFEEQAVYSFSEIAVCSLKGTLTYGRLDNLTNYIAANIREKAGLKCKNNGIVGIMSEKSFEMIVLVIAMWKAGIAYTPLEPLLPVERIEHVLSDCGADGIITSQEYKEIAAAYDNDKIKCIDYTFLKEGYEDDKIYKKINICTPDIGAYIIYTSGTTGKPKGVLVKHKNLVNSILWRHNEYKLDTSDNVLQLFSFMFDGFITSFLTPVVSGSTLHMIGDEKSNDIPFIARYIYDNHITHFISVPQLFGALIECLDAEEMKNIKCVTLAGDIIKKNIVENAKLKNPNLELVNEYGPTETCIVASYHRNITVDDCNVLGNPIYNTHLLVLVKYFKLAPINVPGQLCISGKGVTGGYLNNGSLTKNRFVINPYFKDETMYLTGDIAKINENGDIEFIGRKDSQIKIRGYRIETSEILNALLNFDLINDAYVIVKDNGSEKYLCAIYTGSQDIEVFELKKYLYEKIPSYMVPSFFMRIDAMPLTINGKVDEKILQEISGNIFINSEKYIPPRNKIEEELVSIWCDIFKVENIGIDTNFFDMGGNSINIVRLYNELMKKHNIDLCQSQ